MFMLKYEFPKGKVKVSDLIKSMAEEEKGNIKFTKGFKDFILNSKAINQRTKSVKKKRRGVK